MHVHHIHLLELPVGSEQVTSTTCCLNAPSVRVLVSMLHSYVLTMYGLWRQAHVSRFGSNPDVSTSDVFMSIIFFCFQFFIQQLEMNIIITTVLQMYTFYKPNINNKVYEII